MLKLKEPYLIVGIGLPLSGKSSYFEKNYPDVSLISRDLLIIELGGKSYNESFEMVDHLKINELLTEKLVYNSEKNINTIVDMTSVTKRSRRFVLSYFKSYYKVAIVFPKVSKDDWEIRNKKRNEQENKNISWEAMERISRKYVIPNEDEGFDEIIIF